MTKTVRYQEGYLYVHHEAWYVRYRERVGKKTVRSNSNRRLVGWEAWRIIQANPISSRCWPSSVQVERRQFTPEPGMTLTEFVDKIYLPFLEEKRASTKRGYDAIWKNHIRDRVGNVQLRNFRTVNANRRIGLLYQMMSGLTRRRSTSVLLLK